MALDGHHTDDDDARVIARTPRAPRWLLPWSLVQGAMTAYWGWRIASQEEGTARAVVVAVGIALLVALVVALLSIYRRRGGAALVLSERDLRLERRVQPVVVERRKVLAVRGNVPGRPSWSEQVLVDTQDGQLLTLPPLDRPAAQLVQQLQEWAGVSEQAVRDDGVTP